MLFNSFIFFIFLGVILPVFYALPKKEHRNAFLLLCSYFFYGYWDWRFCFLLMISTVVDFTIGRKLFETPTGKRRKTLLIVSICVNLGILATFKYFGFFIDSFIPIVSLFGGNLDFLHLNVILPVGISFYTFQTMSYTIDIYRNKLEPTHNLIDFALFVAFFPQLVAGPIERAKRLIPQLSKKLSPTKEQIETGAALIVIGLFKKVMIGDAAGRIVDNIFTQPEYYLSIELLSALILFSIQIYADFSGYSSIARGVAKLLGVELMKNFEQPYLSSNITEFWKRWHISLSTWLRDYIYIPLGGNRKGKTRTYINLMLTMLLGGLWHGASWTFVIWGGLHGIYLAVHKWLLRGKKATTEFRYRGLSSLFIYISKVTCTFTLVLFTWLFFRMKDLDHILLFFRKMVFWEVSDLTWRFVTLTLTFLMVTVLIDAFQYYTGRHSFVLMIKNVAVSRAILSALFLITCIYMFQAKVFPFVYFQF